MHTHYLELTILHMPHSPGTLLLSTVLSHVLPLLNFSPPLPSLPTICALILHYTLLGLDGLVGWTVVVGWVQFLPSDAVTVGPYLTDIVYLYISTYPFYLQFYHAFVLILLYYLPAYV